MTESSACAVCAEVLTPANEAWCGVCGEAYHFQQRTDIPGKDCGTVWINEEHLALEFTCNNCLNPTPPGLDDILDLAEAAAAAGLGPADLAAAAERGAVRFRKTGSGTYLFVRKDLDVLRR